MPKATRTFTYLGSNTRYERGQEVDTSGWSKEELAKAETKGLLDESPAPKAAKKTTRKKTTTKKK